MNNLCDLYLAYLEKRKIYEKVKEFQKQENHSRNFAIIMDWINETIEISQFASQQAVTACLMLKTDEETLLITA